jgi:hypothetical protein
MTTAPPPVPPGHWVECPLCHEFFRNEQARGSHLHYVHHQSSARKVRPRYDAPAQEATEAAPMKLPEAAPKVLPATQPTPPAQTPKPRPAPPLPVAEAPTTSPPEPQATAPPAPKPSQPVATAPSQAPAPAAPPKDPQPAATPKPEASQGGELLTALGIGVGSLAALVLANKGKNAPPAKAPAQTEPARPPARLPDGIWAQPEPIQPSGIDYVDRMLGYSGLPKPRRRMWG